MSLPSFFRGSIRPESRPRPREGILLQRVSDTVVLLDPDSGEYFVLEGVGGRVWELCDGTRSVGSIADVIVQEYDAPHHEVEADLLELFGDLQKQRLVVA